MATNFSSSTSSSAPRAERIAFAWARWSAVVSGVAYQTVIPRPSWAGVFGMLRTSSRCPSSPSSAVVVAPAITLRTSWPGARCGPISRPTLASICGLTVSRTTSAPATASTLLAVTRMPWAAASCSRRSGRGWLAITWDGATSWPRMRPAIMDSAMTPVPTVARVRSARGDMGGSVSHRLATSGGRRPGGREGAADRCRRGRDLTGPGPSCRPAPGRRTPRDRRSRPGSRSPRSPAVPVG